MKQLKKTLLTLVALLAVTTQSWATAPTVYSEAVAISQLQVGDILTPGFSLTGNGTVSLQGDRCKMDGSLQSGSNPLVENSYITYNSDGTLTIENMSVTPVDGDGNDGNAWEVTATSPEITIAGTTYTPASGTAVNIAWDAATKTATFTQPAGNVMVTASYYDVAEFADNGEPKAETGVLANTDAPLVSAGVVKNIGNSTTPMGTVMYCVKQQTGNTAPTAPDYNDEGWTDEVPTADGLAEGTYYVWYYIKGAEPANINDRSDENTCNDTPIFALGSTGFVEVGPEPSYKVEFAEGTNEAPNSWTVDPEAAYGETAAGVKKGTKVTLTYDGPRKVIGVKAEKKSATKPVATLTEAPKPYEECYVNGELLETLGTAEGGTLMYKVTTTNEKPTSTEGFSTNNPKGVEASSNKNYIWYYIKGDDTHSDSEIFGPIEVSAWMS